VGGCKGEGKEGDERFGAGGQSLCNLGWWSAVQEIREENNERG